MLAGCGEGDEDARTLTVATFNLHLAGGKPGAAAAEIAAGSPQLDAIAAVIASVDPDVLVLNEVDFDAEATALEALRARLAADGLAWAHAYAAPVNTGLRTGLDIDGDGSTAGPSDAHGWGVFEGQFGLAVLSRLPIEADEARSFRLLRWADVPGAARPDRAPERLRLSSKSHWIVPLRLGEARVGLLMAHPTPPIGNAAMRPVNIARNAAEIDLLRAMIDGAPWLRNDAGEAVAPLKGPLIVAGDLNADPARGDGDRTGIARLLAHPRLTDPLPGQPTAWWPKGPGALRVDYLLPSTEWQVLEAGVVWPEPGEALASEAEAASDHRMVWARLRLK